MSLDSIGIELHLTFSDDHGEPSLSNRGKIAVMEMAELISHVENYTIPQYGDFPHDQITNWTVKDFITQIQKYCNRHGKNSRPGQDALDLMKIAHYAISARVKLMQVATNMTDAELEQSLVPSKDDPNRTVH